MLKRIYRKLFGGDMDIRERMFRIIVLTGSIVSLLGILECLILMDINEILIPLFVLFFSMIIALVATFKYRKISFSTAFIGLIMICIVFPVMFFLSGGLDGGAAIWFVMGLFYIFVMFRGRQLAVFLLINLIVDAGTYCYAYFHPGAVEPMESKAASYMDSFFAVFVVGIAVGVILRLQMQLNDRERSLVLSQKEELEKNRDTKNNFFASMSHEIRTPINSIIGLNEMILRSNPSEETREYAENIQNASKMLLNLVNDILDLSRIEMKRLEILPVEYQTKKLFEELIAMMEIRMQEKKLEFQIDIDSQLPAVLYGDSRRIEQILLNLLTNAVKYTEQGTVTLSVHEEARHGDRIRMTVSVRDTGIGIRKEDMEYLFDSFRRIDEGKNRNVEGSGLGLSITKQLLDLMGGEITVDSIYTKGSVFTVSLEQKIISPSPMGQIRTKDRSSGQRYQYQQSFEAPEARILIVDDNEMNAIVASRLLAATKVHVDIAKSGSECLELTQKKYYHIILMDYMMPEMNGTETLEALRRQENGLCRESAVIFLTAASFDDAKKICAENNVDAYLEKPIRGKTLEKTIVQFLPGDIVEYQAKSPFLPEEGEGNEIQQISSRKRKKVYITSDCVCDLPDELLEKYDIRLMYLYIKTDKGRFADTLEIDSDNMKHYLTDEGSEAHADSVSVEEYEEFFADTLIQAEEIIHVSMAERAGRSYGVAVAASRGFDHVHVVDSAHISGGEGLVVLYAAKLAREGRSVHEICEELDRMKHHVQTRFLLPSARIFYRNGYTNRFVAQVCEVFHLHPILKMTQSRIVISEVRIGNLENVWKRFIRYILFRKWKINTDIVIVTHVGCSVRQQELIRKEISKYVTFKRVIIQKASFSNACNSGNQTIGIAFFMKE